MSGHVPAWKRLGLKLKGPASGEAIASSGAPNTGPKPTPPIPSAHQARTTNGSPASAFKRKLPDSASTPDAAGPAQTPNKKQRRNDTSASQGTPSSLRKSVSFADGTKEDAADRTSEEKRPKKKKATKKTVAASRTDFNLEPSLNYLRQWHTARESWKFNKNHQTLLIKYVFDQDKVPSSDISIFYQYIRDLKGFVRTRLRETAAEIKKKDMEAGADAFPATLKDKETKQNEYDETIARFLQDLHQHQQQQQQHRHQQPNGKNQPDKNANGKRSLDEVEYVLRIATPEVKHRLLKRIRAERVLDELSSSDSEESTASAVSAAATTTTTSGASSSSASTGQGPATAATTAAINGATGRGRSDSSQQPAKRRRLRNVRTDIGDDNSSSSESESSASESDDESSSSSSEDEDGSEDAEMVDAAAGGDAAESSSSSSSSSSSESEAESESESEPGNGTEQESEGKSSSSDED
ncbi:hypothetical protein N657DRAFT_648089 [Parathielavia appendiculata]|uniref:WKF domain-containing protein n=1 Tax=Parathielavia appendiculata TaxID=2587402 RepID=A0AAN6Z0V5_9PEZI|nr:hypothetical protein N657DRAFT_648089 [Parathielavia appendiculata]